MCCIVSRKQSVSQTFCKPGNFSVWTFWGDNSGSVWSVALWACKGAQANALMIITANNHSSQTALKTLILRLCQLNTWLCLLGSQVQTIKGNFREWIPSFPWIAFDKPLGIRPKLVAHENSGCVYHWDLFSCSNTSCGYIALWSIEGAEIAISSFLTVISLL